MRILVIEDDAQVARTVGLGLREAQYEVVLAADGEQGLAQVATKAYDLVVLDLLLPGRSGLEVLRSIRQSGITVPVLILTAKGQLQDRVSGLDAGADDYLIKPFGLAELLARVRALLRRRGDLVQTVHRAADLELDTLRRRVTRAGRPIDLTNREFEVLEFMLRRRNEVVTRATLMQSVWGYNFDPMSNVVDVHMAHLRSKIDEGFTPKLLRTARGQGYVLQAPEPEPPSGTAPPAGDPPTSGASGADRPRSDGRPSRTDAVAVRASAAGSSSQSDAPSS